MGDRKTGFDVGLDEPLADQFVEVFNVAPGVEAVRVWEQLGVRLAAKLDRIEAKLDIIIERRASDG